MVKFKAIIFDKAHAANSNATLPSINIPGRGYFTNISFEIYTGGTEPMRGFFVFGPDIYLEYLDAHIPATAGAFNVMMAPPNNILEEFIMPEEPSGVAHKVAFRHFGNKKIYVNDVEHIQAGLWINAALAANPTLKIIIEADWIPAPNAPQKYRYYHNAFSTASNFTHGYSVPHSMKQCQMKVLLNATAGSGRMTIKRFGPHEGLPFTSQTTVAGSIEDMSGPQLGLTADSNIIDNIVFDSTTLQSVERVYNLGKVSQDEWIAYDFLEEEATIAGTIEFIIVGIPSRSFYSKGAKFVDGTSLLQILPEGGVNN